MGDDGKHQLEDEETYLRKHEQEEIRREWSVQWRGCLVVLLVIGLLGLIIILRVLGR